jgi:hypothetical protein
MIRKLALAAVATTLAVSIAYALSQQTLPADTGNTCLSSLTPAELSSWLDSGAVSLNGAVKPTPRPTYYRASPAML